MSNLPDNPAAPGQGSAPDLEHRVLLLEQEVRELRALLHVRTPFRPPVEAPPPPRPAAVPVPAALSPHGILATTGASDPRSLESLLGARVLSKVAIVLLLLGAAWFLKWAFDNRWIGALGRVLIGLASGAGLILWSERFRRTGTPSISYALKAVGSGVLYLSLWASFHLYHQLPASLALVLMLGVTAWNATLALTQNSRVLAGYALLGAYLTPALLSTGGNHELFLFLYLASIAAAALVLLRARSWNILLLGPLPATTVYFIAWYIEHYRATEFSLTLALSLLLWAILAAIPLLAQDFTDALAGVLQPIGAALFGALTVYSVLVDADHRAAEPWAALAFAAAYLAASRIRSGSVVAAMHLSLALAFVTIAIPLKLTGHGITVGWLAESVALFWIATLPTLDRRARAALDWLGAATVLLGTLGALLGPAIIGDGTVPAFRNRAFATSLGAVAALAAAAILVHRTRERSVLQDLIAPTVFVLLNVVLLVAFFREINRAATTPDTAGFAFSGWMALQGAAMLALGFWRRIPLARWTGLLLLAATILKTVAYDTRNLATGYRVVSYLALGALLMAISYAYQKDWLHLHPDTPQEQHP